MGANHSRGVSADTTLYQGVLLRRVSMMFGNCEIRPSRRPNASNPGISMVSDISAVLSSLFERVLTASTLMRSLSST